MQQNTRAVRTLSAEDFPSSLREIPEPPRTLYIEGQFPKNPDTLFLTVVGSRRITPYGRDACKNIIAGLAGSSICIVSGLAIGTDTEAHRAALNAGLVTIAFPGSGLDRRVLYPRANIMLADEIIASGGALVSEFEPMTRGALHTFPRRNRLMAGIARAVLVIEASERSGTTITARLATEYNRDLFVVPGSIFSDNFTGSHRLIRSGATPVCSGADILSELGIHSNATHTGTVPEGLTAEETSVLDALREPLERDALIRALDMQTNTANVLLMSMELRGLITESLGRYRKTM